MAAELDGPRLEPRGRTGQRLVVFLHGYGADGNDLIDIGRAWQSLLPDAAFVSPHAPQPVRAGADGPRWFPLTFRNPNERWSGVNAAAPVLEQFLDAELARRKLPPSALALVGFSQGTMMALHVGLRRAQPRRRRSSAIPASSCCRTKRAGRGRGRDQSKPPVLLVHGDQDDLIPAQALFMGAQALAALGVPVEWHLSQGIGHGIDQEGLRHGGEFLARRFGLRG